MNKNVVLSLFCALISSSALAGPVMKSLSCMYELQAEAYRFARLHREISQGKMDPAQLNQLKTQAKESTQELFLNLHESKPGLTKLGMQKQYQRLDDTIADYMSAAIISGGDKGSSELIAKQAMLIKVADETGRAIAQKSGSSSVSGLAAIGASKRGVEKLASDFEFCDKNCAQVLPEDIASLEQNIDTMHKTLGKYFSRGSYDLAINQLVFLKSSVDARLKTTNVDATARANMMTTSKHLWEIVDETLDSYTDKTSD